MDLIKQLDLWNEQDDHHKIVDTLEALPEEEKTPELISLLARAYNNLAEPGDRELFERAVELLESVEEECSGEHNWNFRIAYAYFYLDREWLALPYFEKALEYRPGDEDTEKFIEACRRELAMPVNMKPFRQRVQDGWNSFLDGEDKLGAAMDARVDGNELVALCHQLLSPAFDNVYFELGFNGKKHELILTSEGDRAEMFKLVYFKNRAPEKVKEHWDILVGRQPAAGTLLRMYDTEISADDVLVWVEKDDQEPHIGLLVYCEKLLPLLKENENQAYSLFTILLDNSLGEITAVQYVQSLDLLEAPEQGEAIPLSALLGYIRENFDPELPESGGLADSFLETYSVYERKPSEEDDYPRGDSYVGSSRCTSLISDYFQEDESSVNLFQTDGAVPGFFYYSLEGVGNDQILDLRDRLQSEIEKAAGADAVTFIGGATGTTYGYLDLIAWDLQTVLDAAVAAFEAEPVALAVFHTFRLNVHGIRLTANTENN